MFRVNVLGLNVDSSGGSAEAEKNKLAESTLHRLMMHTVWMNIHLAPIPLFEIRVADGYGARWLADGSQVLP